MRILEILINFLKKRGCKCMKIIPEKCKYTTKSLNSCNLIFKINKFLENFTLKNYDSAKTKYTHQDFINYNLQIS